VLKISKTKKDKFRNETLLTPQEMSYAMPAEWEPHAATWLAWPHNQADWPGKFAPIPWIYAEIVRILARAERVNILVLPSAGGSVAREVRGILAKDDVNLAHVTLHACATDRVWVRDSGPIFLTKGSRGRGVKRSRVEGGSLGITDWRFNAWAKYPNWKNDDQLPAYVARQLQVPAWQPQVCGKARKPQRLVLEGGSIDVNGAGALLTTEECLLSRVQQRNPGLTKVQIEQALCAYLGVEQILWLGRGIAGDDTHGHVDDTARFVGPHTIVACVEPDRNDPNCAPLRDNLRRLKKMRDTRGRPFTVVELPLPEPVYFEKQRLPASYANFYIANAGVLVPVFNDANDGRALNILEHCFPGRPIIPVYCRDLVWGLGTLHCMTQQQPAV